MRRPRLGSGRLIVLAFAAFIALGLAVVAFYKLQEASLPPVSASFQRLDAAPANATVHELDFRAVHSRDSFLEDHLETALEHGASQETNRLRVERMRATLTELAGPDATLLVRWSDEVVRVTFSEL